MKLFWISLTLLCVRTAHTQPKHRDIRIAACSDTIKEDMYGIGGEEYIYADFVKKTAVNMLPPFTGRLDQPGMYERALTEMEVCKFNLKVFSEKYKDQQVHKVPPQNSIYSRDKLQIGVQTTLICHSGRFFPPPINMQWTKNGVNVTDSATISQMYPNKDFSYNQFSHLSITPQEGDIYTCTVEHSTLQYPDTKTWEVDVKIPSMGPSVFCGVGLALGLLGVAAGTFFLIKGNQCNS